MKARIPPPLVLLICGILMWVVAEKASVFDFILPHSTPVFWIVLLVGLAVIASGISAIFKHKTIIHPNREALPRATALVTTSVFRYSRNPIYVGMTIMLVAWTIRLENWLSALGIVVFVVFITNYQIKPEEEALEKLFGAEYLRYKQQVRRWV